MKPKSERRYKVTGFIVPAIFSLFTAFYLITAVYNDIQSYLEGKSPFVISALGFLLTCIGIPLFFYFRAKNKN